MVYSIGYENITIEEFTGYVRQHGVTLVVDVRSVPYSRRPDKYEFNKNRLQNRFSGDPSGGGALYVWKGDILGGKYGPATEDGIRYLMLEHGSAKILLLLCLEENPFYCHRRYDIARRLLTHGMDVIHFYRGREKPESEYRQEVLNGRPR